MQKEMVQSTRLISLQQMLTCHCSLRWWWLWCLVGLISNEQEVQQNHAPVVLTVIAALPARKKKKEIDYDQ